MRSLIFTMGEIEQIEALLPGSTNKYPSEIPNQAYVEVLSKAAPTLIRMAKMSLMYSETIEGLAVKISELTHQLGQVSERRREAVDIIEKKRAEIWSLEKKIGQGADGINDAARADLEKD